MSEDRRHPAVTVLLWICRIFWAFVLVLSLVKSAGQGLWNMIAITAFSVLVMAIIYWGHKIVLLWVIRMFSPRKPAPRDARDPV